MWLAGMYLPSVACRVHTAYCASKGLQEVINADCLPYELENSPLGREVNILEECLEQQLAKGS